VVTEQIANLSTGNRRLGSSPSLSARKSQCDRAGFFCAQGEIPRLPGVEGINKDRDQG
jgi:hypothetical protein